MSTTRLSKELATLSRSSLLSNTRVFSVSRVCPRLFSQSAHAQSTTSTSSPNTSAAANSQFLSYHVHRNSRGSLPVYSDIRNGGSRYLLLVRNVKGNANALRDDMAASLFPQGSPEAAKVKIVVKRPDTIALSGGRWKHPILSWLQQKGF